MPWKCPACETAIRHDGDALKPNQVYRCPTCGLELIVDPVNGQMIVAPTGDPGVKR
jgi:DNA-directed RNA polymerase subunit RPC12/RpoP